VSDKNNVSLDSTLKYYESLLLLINDAEIGFSDYVSKYHTKTVNSNMIPCLPNTHVRNECITDTSHNYELYLLCKTQKDTRSLWLKIKIKEIQRYLDIRVLLYVDLRQKSRIEIKPNISIKWNILSPDVINTFPDLEIEFNVISKLIGCVSTPTTRLSLKQIFSKFSEYNTVISPIIAEYGNGESTSTEFCMLKKMISLHEDNHKASIYSEGSSYNFGHVDNIYNMNKACDTSSNSSQSYDSSEEMLIDDTEYNDFSENSEQDVSFIVEIKVKKA
jgi:hypothetical protein